MLKRVLAPLLLSAIGCVQETTIPRLGDKPVTISITTSSSVLRTGESLTISVHIVNTLSEPVQLAFPTLCQVRVFIRNDRGNLVVPADGAHDCPTISSQLTLDAGDSTIREFPWSGGPELDGAAPAQRLPAGRYYITANLDAAGYSTVAFAVLVNIVD